MREISVAHFFKGYDVETVFGTVYVDPACLIEFHTAVNRDPAAIVPAWDGTTGTRTLSFLKPVDAPAFIKRVLGAGTLRVLESQSVATGPLQGSISLASVPCPEMKGADKFKTAVAIDLVPTPSGCQVDGRVSCSAAGPYGLSGAIEGFMADTAKASLVEFFDFCARFLAASSADRLLTGAAEARALLEGVSEQLAAQLPRADSEAWLDAEPLPLPAADSDSAEALYLRYLCSTGDQTVALLQRMDGRLALLRRDARPTSRAGDLALGFAAGLVTVSALGALALSLRRHA